MKTKGTIEQQIAKLERSIDKFGNTELKTEALLKLKVLKLKEGKNENS